MNHKRANRRKVLLDLMADFRKVVVQIQEENDYYKAKANQKLQVGESISSTSTNLTSSTLSSEFDRQPAPPQRPLSSTTATTITTTTSETKSNVRRIIEKFTNQKLFLNKNTIINNDNNNNTTANFNTNSNQKIPSPLLRKIDSIKQTKMASKTTRGALIVLEGLDRVGKSTLANKLVDHLNKIERPVAHYRFPDRTTPIGKLIGDLLKDSSKHIDDHAMHLLFSANRWELNKQIRQTILSGTNVIVDRYSYSGIAYSCAKRDLNSSWCREVEKGLPKPDLVIYLELSKESQYGREGFGDERFEVKEFQELIRKQYKNLIEFSNEYWLKINVENKGPEQVLGEVILPVKRCIDSSANKPLADLDFV